MLLLHMSNTLQLDASNQTRVLGRRSAASFRKLTNKLVVLCLHRCENFSQLLLSFLFLVQLLQQNRQVCLRVQSTHIVLCARGMTPNQSVQQLETGGDSGDRINLEVARLDFTDRMSRWDG